MYTTTKRKSKRKKAGVPATNGKPRGSEALYTREDWTLFRSIRTIAQLSGVPPERLRRLLIKELADNGLDAGGNVRVGELADGSYFIEDDGPGIPATPEEIACLFSFRRPLMSSKVKRLPTRGILVTGYG